MLAAVEVVQSVLTTPVEVNVWLLAVGAVFSMWAWYRWVQVSRSYQQAAGDAASASLLSWSAFCVLREHGLLDEYEAQVEEELEFDCEIDADVTITPDGGFEIDERTAD